MPCNHTSFVLCTPKKIPTSTLAKPQHPPEISTNKKQDAQEFCSIMAHAHSPNGLLRGKIGNQIFRVVNGKQVVSLAPPPWQLKRKHRERMQPDSAHLSYRRNILAFSGASITAKEIYKGLRIANKDQAARIFGPYPQNALIAQLKRHAAERQGETVTAYTPRDVQRALRGLDLSPDAAPSQQATGIKVLGLEKAARRIPVHGNAQLEFRLFIRQGQFSEHRLHPIDQTWGKVRQPAAPTADGHPATFQQLSEPSDWIPVDFIPKEGIVLDLPPQPQHLTYVTAVMVEWREVRAVGRKVHPHHAMSIARIVSVHGPAEAFYAAGYAIGNPTIYTVHSLLRPLHRHTEFIVVRHIADPKAFLARALAKLKPA
jgi:hypothetical protein